MHYVFSHSMPMCSMHSRASCSTCDLYQGHSTGDYLAVVSRPVFYGLVALVARATRPDDAYNFLRGAGLDGISLAGISVERRKTKLAITVSMVSVLTDTHNFVITWATMKGLVLPNGSSRVSINSRQPGARVC